MPAVFKAPVETLPEVAPFVENPVPVQLVALVELQVKVADCPWSTVEGFIERAAVGGITLHNGGLLAPLLHTKGLLGGPSG